MSQSTYGLGSSPGQNPGTGGGMPGPPFASGSADNGLSVDAGTGRIVWGNDSGSGAGGSARLLSNREISVNGFSLTLIDFASGANSVQDVGNIQYDDNAGGSAFYGIGGFLMASAVGEQMAAAAQNGSTRLSLVGDSSIMNKAPGVSIGDLFGGGFDTLLSVRQGAFQMIQGSIGGKVLNMDVANNLYQFGDVDASGGGNPSFLQIDNNPANEELRYLVANARYLSINPGIMAMGDIDGATGGSTNITIVDVAKTIFMSAVGNTAKINMNGVNGFTGTISPVTSITVNGGIVTAVS